VLGGRKVTVTRPRARHLDGSGEVELATYKHFNTEDLLETRPIEASLVDFSNEVGLRYPGPGPCLAG